MEQQIADEQINLGIKDEIDKQIKLLNWKNEQKDLKELSNSMFEKFLYYSFSKPNLDTMLEEQKYKILSNEIASKKTLEYKEVKPPQKVVDNERIKYKRNSQISVNSLAKAKFTCELDPNHKSIIRKNSNMNYTETHHLITMAYQDRYKESLDREENIVSLCSNCHNCIHYGKEAKTMITKLFEIPKDSLYKANIKISLKDLLKIYGIK